MFSPAVGRLMAGSVRTKLDSMASKLSANIVATKKRSAINPKCRFDLPIGQSSARGLRAEIYPGESFHSPEDYSCLFIYLFIFFERQFYIFISTLCRKKNRCYQRKWSDICSFIKRDFWYFVFFLKAIFKNGRIE